MADLGDRTDNVSLTADDGTKPVDVIIDGVGKNRLAVDAVVTEAASSLADQGKAYSIVVPKMTIAVSGEYDFFLLKNASGSGKIVRILDLVYSTDVVKVVLRFYRNPTITANGTALTPVNFKVSGPAATAITAFKSPTISARGTLLRTEVSAGKSLDQSVIPNLIRSLEAAENFLITVDMVKDFDHFLTVAVAEE